MPASVELFKKYPNPVFIETGTCHGIGVQMALDAGFKYVFSIELSFLVILLSFSKGFWLSFLVSLFFIITLTFIYNIRKGNLSKKNVQIIIIVPFITFLFFYFNPIIIDGLLVFISPEAIGNSLRNEQAKYLSSEFTLVGSGFGVPLKSGYMRDMNGYAFELSYYNLLHKLGFFSFFIILSFGYLIAISIKHFIKNGPTFFSILSISSLSFLISASGNPLLFASLNMIIFSIIASQFKLHFYDFK